MRILAFLLSVALASAQPQPIGDLDPLILTGQAGGDTWGAAAVQLDSARRRAIDGAGLIERVPGAAVVRNGSQTGIAQLRGLSGDRVQVLLDDMCVSPACPNHMDPPLHYASAASDTRLELIPGVAPVRYGGDNIGGTIRLSRPDPVFAGAGQTMRSGELGSRYFGSHDGWGASGEFSAANDEARFDYHGGWSTADDLRIPGGSVRASGYDSHQHHEITGSFRLPNGFLAVDTGFTRVRDAGTPALPMDMVESDSRHFGLRHQAGFGAATLETRLYFHFIDHLMDNFSLRPTPAMQMEAPTSSRDYGLRSQLELPCDDHSIRVGIDLHHNEFDADQVQLATGKSRDMFADNRRDLSGAFAEWEQDWSGTWSSLLGLRADLVRTEAGFVSSEFGPPQVAADAAAFNSGKRSHSDLLVDFVAAARFEPDESSRYELALGIKNRAPSLLERYLWTPGNASAGRADGRSYLGNPALDPETSFQLSATAAHRGECWSLRFTPFYNHVHDYIQGSPIARLDPAGQAVLQFKNFDRVELYGAELAGSIDFTDQLSLAAQLSYVRGRNRTTSDNLYRIAPLHGLLDLGWDGGPWEAHLELDWAARQDKVSRFNDESPGSGYALVHLRGAYQFDCGLRLGAGVENIFDKHYAQHLSGVNRVTTSDVAVGRRIPGASRFFYADLGWSF